MFLGSAVAAVLCATSLSLLGAAGHGFPIFVILAGTPSPYGFGLPLLSALLMAIGWRWQLSAGAIFVESLQVYCALSLMRNKYDFGDVTLAARHSPGLTIIFISTFLSWKAFVVARTVVLAARIRREGSPRRIQT
jgi:hypothetical protein